MSWLLLMVAGLFEVAWAALLGETKGFSRAAPTAGFLAALVASMYLLSLATKTIPVGTAYAIWVGIGAVGAFVYSVTLRNEPTSAAQVAAMSALVLAIVAVKVTAPH
jgi:quaternary ammonium compound-resistance protein SugE